MPHFRVGCSGAVEPGSYGLKPAPRPEATSVEVGPICSLIALLPGRLTALGETRHFGLLAGVRSYPR